MVDWPAARADWTDERLEAAMSFLTRRILADFGGVSQLPAAKMLTLRVDPADVLAVAFGGEHEFPIELQEGVEAACALVADQVQDGVIDRLGRPWPELREPAGGFVGVLDPSCEPFGLAHWALRGRPFCAVGQLHDAVAAAGLRIG